MEKNLNKYVTIGDAVKMNLLKEEHIKRLIESNSLPYFSDTKDILVNPEDITEKIETWLEGKPKKKYQKNEKQRESTRQTEPEPQTTAEEVQ